jgi:hypothetical protein
VATAADLIARLLAVEVDFDARGWIKLLAKRHPTSSSSRII